MELDLRIGSLISRGVRRAGRLLAGCGLALMASSALAQTGAALPGLVHYDDAVAALMARWQIPGASVAVVKDGRLVMARGYGRADEAGTPVEPAALFRIASLSKPITALAVMRLAQDGLVDLDQSIYAFLGIERPNDPRSARVTIRHALEHSGGWDRSADGVGDVLFMPRTIAAAVGSPSPPDVAAIVGYQASRALELDFAPGTRFAYSNYGYLLLSLVIEKASGMPYEDFVRMMAAAAGSDRLLLGRTSPAHRAGAEVKYFDSPAAPRVLSVDDDQGAVVSRPDGGFVLETLLGAGAWIASPVDLLRFLVAIEGLDGGAPLLSPALRAEMTARPNRPDAAGALSYYAKGWKVRPTRDGGANWWHEGSLPGSSAYLVRLSNGVSYAALFNSRPEDADAFFADLDRTLFAAQARVSAWPAGNLFDAFASRAPVAPALPLAGD